MKKSISRVILTSLILFCLQFSISAQQATVDILVVSGGGSGGAGYGGGGGGGAVKYFTSQTASGTTSVIVGAGGAAVNITTNSTPVTGNPGESSSFGSLVATSSSSANGPNSSGGGGGGAGSGGGAGGNFNTTSISGGTAVSGMGNNGGGAQGNGATFSLLCGGGGGGAEAAGGKGGSPTVKGGNGGAGISNSVSGSDVYYGGGGGGGTRSNSLAVGAGGIGGGGAGSKGNVSGTNATANSGGGGGGLGGPPDVGSYYSGAGGSGVVIVRYLGSTTLASGGVITKSGGYTIHTFNSSGDFTLLCNNPSSGGTIAAAQSGSNGFNPAAFTSSAAASNDYMGGTLEYKWQSSTTSNSAGFSDIASSNSATYDAGALTQTTWFKRLARVDCKSDWTGAAESNVLEICITPTAGITNNTGSTALTCNRTSINVTATGGVSYAWSGGLGSSDAATISSAGTYTVTVTGANSCTSTAAISIVSIPSPNATISASGATTFTYGNSVVLSGPQVVPVSEGNALCLNGTSNYVSIPSGINSNFSGNQITVEGWFYPTQSFPKTALIGETFEGDGKIKFALFSEDVGGGVQNIRAGFYSPSTDWVQVTSSANLPFNQWTHIAATYDQANVKIYVNGALTCTLANTNPLPNGTERWLLGKCWDCSNFFPGKMDEVRIWNVARTQSQIQEAMNTTISPTTSGLVGYYKMDEASGSSAADATGHGYTGTVN